MVTSKNISMSLLEQVAALSPYTVGFERQFSRLKDFESLQKQTTGYPPYNIRKVDDYIHVIELALAGFSKDDVEVEIADGKLTIRSVKESDTEDDGTIHRGISYRKFNRQFTLADDIVVNGASLDNGLLTVTLEQIVPEEKKPRLIEVK